MRAYACVVCAKTGVGEREGDEKRLSRHASERV